MSDEVNGSGGIPRDGREVEYATELWLADPTAFFLHPEGPLSDTTPQEWQAKQEEKRREEAVSDPLAQLARGCYARYGNLQQAYYQQQLMSLQSYGQSYQNQLSNQLLGFRLF